MTKDLSARDDPFTKLEAEGRRQEDGSFPGGGTSEKVAASSEESPHEGRRRCNPTKRWALVAWFVGAALLIALIVILVSAYVVRP
mmetsp:Transcript_18584/g.30836  ORF Transcript_18584/g.30836 Transcript_18584/m.30836 type:complete len:85 (-) Transcript_18584:597-851(-)